MRINVCFATDEPYVFAMATAMASILKNAKRQDDIWFFILCNDVSDETKSKIRRLQKLRNCTINFTDIDISEFRDFPAGGPHITNTTYYRFKIADMFPDVARIIYFDCDVIVRNSLAHLFTLDLQDYCLAGVEDVGYYYWRDHIPELIWDGYYINAGVLVINLTQWRTENAYQKLRDFTVNAISDIKIGDQDVINRVFKNRIHRLDYQWNVQDSFFRYEPEVRYNPNKAAIIQAALKPSVVHFTNWRKPWSDITTILAFEWFYYNRLTAFRLKWPFKLDRNWIFSIYEISIYHCVTLFGMKFYFKSSKYRHVPK